MFLKKWFSLFNILDEPPFFKELSMRERERLIIELLQSCPQLDWHKSRDVEVGNEAQWLMEHAYSH
jgi:Uma2 family endonuclease